MSEEAADQILALLVAAALLWPWPILIAYRKGMALGPIIAGTILLYPLGFLGAIFGNRNQAVLDQRRADKGVERKCPHCASFIRREASVCPQCQRDVPAVA